MFIWLVYDSFFGYIAYCEGNLLIFELGWDISLFPFQFRDSNAPGSFWVPISWKILCYPTSATKMRKGMCPAWRWFTIQGTEWKSVIQHVCNMRLKQLCRKFAIPEQGNPQGWGTDPSALGQVCVNNIVFSMSGGSCVPLRGERRDLRSSLLCRTFGQPPRKTV